MNILRHWFSRYGVPNQLVSDNGTQFVSLEFEIFCRKNGINHIKIPRYHQSSNGLAERFVQTVKKGLKRSSIKRGDIRRKLDNFLFAYRITPTTSTGLTPAELFLGRRLKSRLDLIQPYRGERHPEKLSNVITHVRSFGKDQHVLVRNHAKGALKKWIPGLILEKIGSKCYLVKVGDRRIKINVDHILKNNTKYRQTIHPDEFMFCDLADNASNSEIFEISERRYPLRIRRPVERYGSTPL